MHPSFAASMRWVRVAAQRPARRSGCAASFAPRGWPVRLVSRHGSSVGLRWPSKRIAAVHRLPIQLGIGKRYPLRCAPVAARRPRHLIGDTTLASSLLFLASGIALADCDNRFSGAVEASKQQFEPAPMNYLGQQLVSKGSLNTAWSLDQGCSLGDGYKTRLKAMVNGSASSGHAGA